MISPRHKPQRQPDYRLELLDDELLLFHPGLAKILYCNQTAGLIWRLCDGQHTVEEITNLLNAAFPEATNLAADVTATLQQFEQHEAIAWKLD